jgi:HEAT repeat protein
MMFLKTLAFFTALLPIWKERPLSNQDLAPGPAPYAFTAAEKTLQEDALRQADGDLRELVAFDLGRCGSPEAVALLSTHLSAEKDARVLCTVLQQLTLQETLPDVSAATLQTMLEHSDAPVRYWAVRLCTRLQQFKIKTMQDLALQDPVPQVRSAAWEALRVQADRVAPDLLKTARDSADDQVRAAAVRVLCARRNAPADLLKISGDSSVLVRQALAAGLRLPVARQVLDKLSADSMPAIREQLALTLESNQHEDGLPVLLKLADDSDAEIRRIAVRALALFPREEVAAKVVSHFEDSSAKVRRQAEAGAVAVHPRLNLESHLRRQLEGDNAFARFHAYRAVGLLNCRAQIAPVVQAFARESAADNLAAGIFALGRLGVRDSAAEIAEQTAHSAPQVRLAVAQALGLLNQPGTFESLKKLTFDSDGEVRQAALVAIARIGDGKAFNGTILKMLKSVRSPIGDVDRATACWAAARLRPVDPGLIQRLRILATQPVIPAEMGEKMFDSELVLVSVDFALAALGREGDASARAALPAISRLHQTPPEPGAEFSGKAPVFAATDSLREYSRQADLFLEGQDAAPARRTESKFSFHYRPFTKN